MGFLKVDVLVVLAVAQIDKEFISGEAMMDWLESWDRLQVLRVPKVGVFRP